MNNKPTPHKHAQAIKDWADGYTMQYKDPLTGLWYDMKNYAWQPSHEYRRKPEIPKSGLTDEQMCYIILAGSQSDLTLQEWRAIADAAVSNFIQIDMNTYLDTLKGQNET